MSFARRTAPMQNTYVNAQSFHANLDKQRALEAKTQVLHHHVQTNKRYEGQNGQEERVEVKRRQQRYKQQNSELMTGYAIEQAAKDEYQRKILREQDDSMAAAIFDMKTQTSAAEINARRICEESEELKELKEKLRASKISRARAVQLQERDLMQQQKFAEEMAMDSMMDRERKQSQKRAEEEEMRRLTMNHQRKAVILNQIAEKETAKKQAYEEFLREKAMVDEIVRGIEAEDQEKQMLADKRRSELQANIRSFLAERQIWKEEEKARVQAELDQIAEYNRQQGKRHAEAMATKKKIADQQDAVLRKLTLELNAKRKEEDEIRELLDELYQEEAEQKSQARVDRDNENRKRMQEEMVDANNYQKALKQRQAEQRRAEEEDFRQQMYERFAADKRLEQMNNQRRRREMENYKKEVENLVQERRAAYDAAVQAEKEEMRINDEQERYRLGVVERERQRLLREHARDLQDYLPKGVLANENDYETVYGTKPRGDQSLVTEDIFGNPIRKSRPSSGRRAM